MHTHMSLFEGDRNAFHEAGGEYHLSKVGARSSRLLRHAADHRGDESVGELVQAAVGRRRGSGVRVLGSQQLLRAGARPHVQATEGPVDRIELRSLDSACNPYLAFALMLSAGLKGIENGYDLPPGAEDDVWALTEAERRSLGIDPLPQNLSEAMRVMENSELVAETLGEHVRLLLRNKRAEWQDYRRQVTVYERDRYLPVLQPCPSPRLSTARIHPQPCSSPELGRDCWVAFQG